MRRRSAPTIKAVELGQFRWPRRACDPAATAAFRPQRHLALRGSTVVIGTSLVRCYDGISCRDLVDPGMDLGRAAVELGFDVHFGGVERSHETTQFDVHSQQ